MADHPEINVQRRRKGSRPTTQAGTPIRRDSGKPSSGYAGQSTNYSSGGTVPTGSVAGSGGSLLRGTTGKLGCGGIVLIILLVIGFLLLRNCGGLSILPSSSLPEDDNDQNSYQEFESTIPTSTPRPRPEVSSSGSSTNDKWLVMVYQDADDQVLEQDIFLDMNEMERIGSTEQVMIVTQLDRYHSGFSGSENWHSTRRYLVTYDDDLNRIGSDLIQDIGEVNMASGKSLVDFVTWAIESYPADNYVLILSDHGMGWPGGWSDQTTRTSDSSQAPLVAQLQHDSIYLSEMDDALSQIQKLTGIEKFDLIGMDACLMSQLEVYTMLQPYAHVAVASEETEPALGWAYSAFLSLLVYDPSIDARTLAANIVETYVDQDERIVDDQARAEFLRQNSSTGSFFGAYRVSAAQLADQLEQNITLTAIDLDKLPDLTSSFNNFAYLLQSIDQRIVATARGYTQSYTSIFGRQVPPSYIDLGHFVKLVAKNTNDSTIRQSANQVLENLENAIIAERHGQTKPGSTGIAIYFPNSALYKNPATGMQSYVTLANRFSRESLWDDFLVFHYTNRSFKSTLVEPGIPSSTISRAPGLGDISISQIRSSSKSLGLNDYVKLSVDITGENIGYIYLFTGFYDPTSNSILVIDTDYLESTTTQQENGVYYPVWPDAQSFTLNYEWEPVLFAITDGRTTELALFNPISYGADASKAVYVVQGTYTFSETGEQRKAELYFMDGKLFQIYGYAGNEEVGAPSEITPTSGDTFTLSDKWLELDPSGNVTGAIYEEGKTLTFSNTAFTWETVYTPYGDYLVGFLVSDLDGNLTPAYTQLTVQ